MRKTIIQFVSIIPCVAALLAPGMAWAYDYEDVADQMKVQVADYEGVKLSIGLKTAGRLQALDHSDAFQTARPSEEDPTPSAAELDSLEPGFQTAWGSMDFKANFEDLIEVYWEFFMSSRPHPDAMQGSQGYLLIHGLPGEKLQPLFDLVSIKAGEFEVNFGDAIYRRSDNARVQRNPLIGNYVIDPRSTEIGLEVITKPAAVNGALGVTSGTATEDFSDGHGTAFYGKLWLTPNENIRWANSVYHVDHSDNGAGFPAGGTKNNLFSTERGGGPYSGVLDDGNSPGTVFVGRGQKVLAAQTDVTWDVGDFELYSNFGYTEDGDTNGSADGEPEDSWIYYAVEGVYSFSDDFYGAVRYSAASAEELGGEDVGGRVDRIQVGMGYWLSNFLLAKAEYVYQSFSDFDAGSVVSGVDADRDPSFQGVIAEVSFAF